MNYFKRLVIENFQSHDHTIIDFSKGLNVFVGPSDSGKSAILRALKWLLFNSPRGMDFIRSGTKECRVALTFEDGTQVIRMRGSSVNRYVLWTSSGEEHIFEGFGNEIPQEITDIHQIKMLKIDGREMILHLGTQLESPFLLFETAGSKAKTIGRISGAHLIDKAFKKTTNDRQSTNIEIKRLEHEIEELTEQLLPYAGLENIEQQLYCAEDSFVRVKRRKKQVERLQEVMKELQIITKEKAIHEKWLKQKEAILTLNALLNDLGRKEILLKQLIRLEKKWKMVEQEKHISSEKVAKKHLILKTEQKIEEIYKNRKHLTQIKKLNDKWVEVSKEKDNLQKKTANKEMLFNTEKSLGKLYDSVQKVHTMSKIHQRWKDVTTRITRGKQFQAEKEKEIAFLTQKWLTTLKDLKKCPTCGSQVNLSIVEGIIEEYQGGDTYVAVGREHSND